MVCVPDYCLLVITCNLQCEGHTEWEDERREEQAIDYSLTKFGDSILFVIVGNLYVSKLAINKPNKNIDVVMISEKVLSKVSVSYKQNKINPQQHLKLVFVEEGTQQSIWRNM